MRSPISKRNLAPTAVALASCASALLLTGAAVALSYPRTQMTQAWLATAAGSMLVLKGPRVCRHPAVLAAFLAGLALANALMSEPLWRCVLSPLLTLSQIVLLQRVAHGEGREPQAPGHRVPAEARAVAAYVLLGTLAAAVMGVALQLSGETRDSLAGLRTWWIWEMIGMLLVFPVAMLSSKAECAELRTPKSLLRSGLVVLAALLIATWTLHQPHHYFLYLVTSLILAAFFVPAIATAIATTAGLLLLLVSGVPGFEAAGVAPYEDNALVRIALAVIAPTCVAFLLRERSRGKRLLERVTDQSDARFRQAVEAAPIAFLVADRSGRITIANPEAEKLFGFQEGRLLGQSIDILLPERARGAHAALRQEFHASPSPRRIGVGRELTAVRSDGREFLVEVGLSPIETQEGPSVLAMVLDITARKQAEDALDHQRDSLRLAKEAAEAANQAKSRLFAAISHEIRTPMNVVLGMNRLARMQPCAPAVADYLAKIEGSAKYLLGILNDVLDFSKIDAGQMTVERNTFAVADVMEMTTALVTSLNTNRKLSYILEVAEDVPPYLIGDQLRLQQVLANLLNNAVKFTPEGNIALELSVLQRMRETIVLRFTVRDTGIGMNPDQLAHVFQAFWQADSSNTRLRAGTGLGLDISRRLVELMDGRIEVDSQAGAGTQFSIVVPFGLTCAQPVNRRDLAEATRKSGVLSGLRILIAEDHRLNHEVVSEFLRGFGIETTRAANGQEAISLANSQPFDIVLMDLQMPVVDGFDATRAIRTTHAAHELPIIAMSADAFADDKSRCYRAGMNDHVAKPFDPDVLISVLGLWSGRATDLIPLAAPAPISPEPLALVASEQALARINQNQPLYRELLSAFAADHERTVARIGEYAATHAGSELRSLAHRLRSEAHNLGLTRLGSVAADLELELRSNPDLIVRPSVDSFAVVFDATLRAVHRLLAAQATPTHPQSDSRASTIPPTLLSAVHDVSQQLSANRLDALRALGDLELSVVGTPGHPQLQEVTRLARQLKFKEAAARLDTIARSMEAHCR